MWRSVWLVLLLLPLGCARPTAPETDGDGALVPDRSGESLTVDRDEYRHGDVAQLRLSNTFQEAIGYNLCSISRERWNGSEWKRVEFNRICTMELRTLEPGRQVSQGERITTEWEPGRYRMLAAVELMRSNSRALLRSQAFEVRR